MKHSRKFLIICAFLQIKQKLYIKFFMPLI